MPFDPNHNLQPQEQIWGLPQSPRICINSPQAEAYFARADRRVMIGLRATLEMLGIPIPDYAHRRKPGPTPASAALAAFAADNPTLRSTVLAERRPNASPERVAAVKAANQARFTDARGFLFNQVFPG
jgi:hypothetical protein